MPRALDLLGTAETAEELGVERSRLSRWRRNGVVVASGERVDFPKPVLVLRATPLWRGRDIRALRDRLQAPPLNNESGHSRRKS